ncbi:MAG: hypothetical protein EAZ95_19295 [Bacteroidetes bacterium]|nr:MAG: hypothetical protein EAZ95_19295 [Bacteroidota bacterium]
MYRLINDFLTDWKHEVSATIRLLENLTEESLQQKVYRQGRELGRIVWHIVQTIPEMGHKAGLFEEDLLAGQKMPVFLPAIIASYRGQSNRLIEAVQQKWKDADLPELISMYGESWARGKVLQVFITHQAHHRGQMTVLMRQAGLKVVGVYGPAREEWKAMGLPTSD